jgi:hypothetical protein
MTLHTVVRRLSSGFQVKLGISNFMGYSQNANHDDPSDYAIDKAA